jgi:hypothetical protein
MSGINWDAASEALRQAAVKLPDEKVEYEVRDDGLVVPVNRRAGDRRQSVGWASRFLPSSPA